MHVFKKFRSLLQSLCLKVAKILEKAARRDLFDLSMPEEQLLVLNV